MKQCPTCQVNYSDETLNFCLNDGTPLVRAQVDNSTPQIISTTANRANYNRRFTSTQLAIIFACAVIGLCGLPLGFFGISGYLQTSDNILKGGGGIGQSNSNSKPSVTPTVNLPDLKTSPEGSTSQKTASFNWEVQRTLSGHSESVHDVAFSPDGKLVASASWDNSVSVWDVETGVRKHTFQHGFHPHKVVFTPDGNSLYSSGGNGLIKMWNLQSGESKTVFNAKVDFVQLSPSADGSLLACDCSQKGVKVIDAKTGAVKFSASRDDYVWGVALSPDGRLLAAAGGSKKRLPLIMWDIQTGQVKNTIGGEKTIEANVLSFSPDGELLAVGSSMGGLIRLFDVNTGELKKELAGRGDQVQRIVFSPDKRTIFAVIGGFAQIYDLQENKWVGELNRTAYALDVSADGKTLVTADPDKTVRVWK